MGWGVVQAATSKRHGRAEDGPGGAGAGAGALAQDCGALLAAKTACEQEVEEMCAIMGVKVGRLGVCGVGVIETVTGDRGRMFGAGAEVRGLL